MSYVCKECGKADGLYETGTVDAWRSISVEVMEAGRLQKIEEGHPEIEGRDTFEGSGYGRSCGSSDK